ncbi:MAG TPA: molybdopterin-dependent oxidoreductase [Rhodospirillaceae bacterium]|nr:molybdopterin-dependent oxidoreductase [Rhodospirillaceae bacterium]
MDGHPQGDRKKVATYCYQCVNGPDLLTVEVVDGVATKVEPNFAVHGLHPADGKVCVKPYGLIQKQYNPNRILTPMKRTNPKKGRNEDPGWVRISWEEALDTVAAKLAACRPELLDENGNPKLAFTTGGAGTPLFYMGAFPALFAAWGGPVDLSLGAGGTVKCYHAEHSFGELWHRAFTVCPDTPYCNYVVSFGNNIDASGGVPSARRQADARVRGLRKVQIEPHLSVTGAGADDWVPIRPKTDPAFLMAMLHVLLHEHRTDELDVVFLKTRTAAPYLIAPEGYYLRDADSGKPLVWDLRQGRAVPFDSPGADPALNGRFTAGGIEKGADGQTWTHDGITVAPAHQMLTDHVASYTPKWAAAICDVQEAAIRRIADTFLAEACIGETIEIGGRVLPFRPVAIMLGKSVNNGWGAYECVWARTVLQTLVGALEVPGGLIGTTTLIVGPEFDRMASCVPGEDGFMTHPFSPTDKEHWQSRPEVRHGHTTLIPHTGAGYYAQPLGSSTFAWMRMQGRAAESWVKPKPPEVWIVYRCNPLISHSETNRLMDSIAEFPFQLSFVYTMDETAHFADILLPDCTDLEGTQLIRLGGTHYFEQFWETEGWVLRQPVVEPQGEARDFTWIAAELAKRIGLLDAFNSMVNVGVCGIPLKTDGYDFSLDVAKQHSPDEIWDAVCRAASFEVTGGKASDGLDWFKRNGFRVKPFPKLSWYLLPRMEDQNLRFELPYQERLHRIGEQLANRLHENNISWWDKQLTDYEPMPHWKDLNLLWDTALEKNYQVKADDYPFWLLTSRSMQYAWGGNVTIQLMREVADNVIGHGGIQMNANRARDLGIEDGDRIEVTSAVGTTTGKVILRQGVRPDVIVMTGQFGHWKTPYAKDLKTPSLNSLVPMHMDFIDGTGSSVDAAKVKIRRLGR